MLLPLHNETRTRKENTIVASLGIRANEDRECYVAFEAFDVSFTRTNVKLVTEQVAKYLTALIMK